MTHDPSMRVARQSCAVKNIRSSVESNARKRALRAFNDEAAARANARAIAEEMLALADRAVIIAEAVEEGTLFPGKAATLARFDRIVIAHLADSVLDEAGALR